MQPYVNKFSPNGTQLLNNSMIVKVKRKYLTMIAGHLVSIIQRSSRMSENDPADEVYLAWN